MKRVICVFLSVAMLLSITACIDLSAYADTVDDSEYTVPGDEHIHAWDSGMVLQAATCSEDGVKTYTCTDCGETRTEAIPYAKTVTLSAESYTYDGKSKKPAITVKDSDENTISTSNYTVTYSNNTDVGTAAVNITFEGDYSGTIGKTFKINPKNTSISSVSAQYKGFTVKLNKYTTQTTGYQIQYSTSSSFSGAKTVSIGNTTTSKTVTGLTAKKKYYVRVRTYKTVGSTKYYSGWSGAKTVTTSSYPTTITLSATSYTYDGKAKKPTVTVKNNGTKISSKYYTVSYSGGRKNVGTYTVTIKFKKPYSGTVKKTFTIKPKATTLSSVTQKSNGFTVKWKKQTAQTTGYQIQYSTSSSFSGAKTLTVTKNTTASKTVSGLTSGKKYYVRIRTYKKNSSSVTYYSSWSKVKTVIVYSNIPMSKSSINIGNGETVSVYNLIKNSNKAADTAYTYTSSNSKIATVSKSGNVLGKGTGTATITIKKGYTKTAITVNVKKGATKISLNYTSAKLGIGEKVDLNSSATGGYAYKRAYSSSNTSVAKVNSNGVVTALKEGTAKIKVTTFNNKTATCTVTVCKAPQSIKITNENNIIQKNSDNHKIKYSLSSGAASFSIKYSVKDTSIATVDSKGYITGKKNGTTTVTVKTYNGLTATQQIKVTNDSLTLNVNSTQLALDNENVEKIKYGTSVQGRNLEAFVITNNGKYKKTLFMDFAVHGFEDSYKRDGQVLVNEANALIEYFAAHPSELGNFRLVIVPCANPDGTIAGTNNQRACSTAFGRCTAKHIDMNRDFGPFKAVETRKLRDLIVDSNPNIYLNMHGWLNETLGTKKLNTIINKQLGLSRAQNGVYGAGSGYAIGWVHNNLNIPACLVEYKSPKTVSTTKDVKMIKAIIEEYS